MAAGGVTADHQRPHELRMLARRHLHLPDDIADRYVGAKVVAGYRDVDAVGVQAAGEMAEERAVERLPVAAVDENDDRPRAVAGKEIDPVARAAAIRDHAPAALPCLAIGSRVARPAGHDRRVFGNPGPVVVFDLVVDIRLQRISLSVTALRQIARCLADFCADALVLANSRINSRTSFGVRSPKMSAIHNSCSAAILRNSARPAFVSRITWTRRSESEVRRSRWPDSTRRSTSPVTLPFETIIRFETSDNVMPSGALSSWAIRSKPCSVTSKRSLHRPRTSPSITLLQVSKRSHNLISSP